MNIDPIQRVVENVVRAAIGPMSRRNVLEYALDAFHAAGSVDAVARALRACLWAGTVVRGAVDDYFGEPTYIAGLIPGVPTDVVQVMFVCMAARPGTDYGYCEGDGVATVPRAVWEARKTMTLCPTCGRVLRQHESGRAGQWDLIDGALLDERQQLAHKDRPTPGPEPILTLAHRAAFAKRILAELRAEEPLG